MSDQDKIDKQKDSDIQRPMSELPVEMIVAIATFLPLSDVRRWAMTDHRTHNALSKIFDDVMKLQHQAMLMIWQSQPTLSKIGEVAQVAGCSSHIAAVSKDHQLLMFGRNHAGQCGVEGQAFLGKFQQINLPEPVKKVVVASERTVAIGESGKLYGTGKTELKLHEGSHLFKDYPFSNVKDVAIAKNFSIMIDLQGNVTARGSTAHGKLGFRGLSSENEGRKLTDLPPMKNVAVSDGHAVLLSEQGKVYVTGHNTRGQLGVDDTDTRYRFTEVLGLRNIQEIKAGNGYTLCKNQNGQWLFAGDVTSIQPEDTKITHSEKFTELSSPPQYYQLANSVGLPGR